MKCCAEESYWGRGNQASRSIKNQQRIDLVGFTGEVTSFEISTIHLTTSYMHNRATILEKKEKCKSSKVLQTILPSRTLMA